MEKQGEAQALGHTGQPVTPAASGVPRARDKALAQDATDMLSSASISRSLASPVLVAFHRSDSTNPAGGQWLPFSTLVEERWIAGDVLAAITLMPLADGALADG